MAPGDRTAWSAPGPETVVPGLHRIPLPLPMDGLRAVNVYALEDGDGLTLIDGGWAIDESRAELDRALGALGRDLREVRRVLVTHVHRDHYTQAVAVRRAVGARVALGADERGSMRTLTSGEADILAEQPVRLRRHGAGALADELAAIPLDRFGTLAFYEDPDEWLEPGPVPLADGGALAAVPTPGHTRGHLVFHWAERGVLFAGDHVLPHITPSIGFEPDRPPFPLRDYLGSLARVLALPDAVLLPAHGPAGGSVHARVRELLEHHEVRLADTREALAAGAGVALDAARRLRWTSRGRAYDDLNPFDRMLAVLETAAHLDVLVLRGEAVRDDAGDVITYAPAPASSET